MEPSLIIIKINSILTGILLVLFFRDFLNRNSLKDPRITNVEADKIRKQIDRREIVLCFLGFTSAVLFFIENFKCSLDSISVYLSLAIILMVIISIILKKVVKVKIANKMCVISMVILAVTFFIKPIYCNNYYISHEGGCFSDFEITAFNTKFTQYEGEKTGAQIRALLNEIVTSNTNPENKDKQIYVTILDKKGNPWTEVSVDNNVINGNITAIKINSRNKVEFKYSEYGYINKCIITQLNK